MNNEPRFNIGDMVKRKDDEVTNFGIGIITEEVILNFTPAFCITWILQDVPIEYAVSSSYCDADMLLKVS